MPMRVTFAGHVAIDVNGSAADLTGLGRVGRLFWAYLASERHRPVPRDELAEVLWGGDQLPGSWEQMLRGHASKLRASLGSVGVGPAVLVSAFGAYQVQLPAGAVVDVEEAVADLERALAALAAGDAEDAGRLADASVGVSARGFLPGWSGLWIERRQAEVRELHLRALEALARADCAQGKWGDALISAEGAVGLEPFRESAVQILMAAHRGAGNLGEALRAYERCRRTLAEQLGVSPSAATENAYVSLLTDDPAEPPIEVAQPLQAVLTFSPRSFLVGRDAAMGRLEAAFQRATNQGRQVVLVEGEPGIGKTTLVAHFARQAHVRGADVLYGRCDEDLGVAYQPFAEALGHHVANCPLAQLSAHVAAHGAELSRIAPELSRRLPAAPVPPLTGSEGDRYRLFEAVTALLDQTARGRTLVLVIDDLQWAAPPTLSLLNHVLRSRTSSLLVVGAYRHTELGPQHPLATTLADLRRDQGVERMLLEGLDEPGVSDFVRQFEGRAPATAGESLARALHGRTGGNPFFVGEFMRHLAESGAVYRKEGSWTYYEDDEGLGLPEGVRDVVARRLSRLSSTANRILTFASVVGLEFDVAVVEHMGLAPGGDTVLDALDEAIAAHVVTEVDARRYQFAHALVRDTIYSTLTAARRSRLHHRAGDALAALPGDVSSRLPALAHHFAEAAADGAAARAGDYALAAAQQAFSKGAWDDAAAFVRMGLGVLSPTDPEHLALRFDLLVLEVETQLVAVRIGMAIVAMRDAMETARLLGSNERLARAVTLYLLSEGFGDPRAMELAEAALQGLGDSEPALRAGVLSGLSVTIPRRDAGTSDAQSRVAVALARDSGDRNAIHAALVARRTFLCDTARASEWLAVEEELAALGPPAGPVAGTRWIHSVGRGRAIAHLVLGDRTGFEADIRGVERWFAELRNVGLGVQLAFWRAAEALLDGRFGDVERHASAARTLAPGHDDVWAIQMGRLALDQGRTEEAKEELLAVLVRRPRHNILLSMAAFAHTEVGEHDAARRIVDELAAEDFRRVRRQATSTTLAYMAEVAAALDDRSLAARLYEIHAPHAGLAVVSGVAGAHCPGAADRYLGQLSATLGRWDDAEGHYKVALTVERGLRSPPLQARTRYWYGRMFRERKGPGDTERANDLLTRAADTALELGMARLAAQATALL